MNKPFGRRPLPQRRSLQQRHHLLLLPQQAQLINSSASIQTTDNLQDLCMSRVNKNNLSFVYTNVQIHKCTNTQMYQYTNAQTHNYKNE